MKRIAILDLGTNTFHLLIAEKYPGNSHSVLYKTEQFVKLAEGGIAHFSDAAFERGITLLKCYRQTIDEFDVHIIYAFGTEAIRRADNSEKFIEAVKKETGIEIKKISGDEEANFIYLAARWAVTLDREPALVMDIGGGSAEFIICNNERLFWERSFPLGATVLKQQFHKTDIITESEIKALNLYLESQLQPLSEQAKKYHFKKFIGDAGSFDSLAEMVAYQFYTPEILKGKTSIKISKEQFETLYKKVIFSTLEERLHMQGLPEMRADMIVVSFIFIKFILDKFQFTEIYQSAYSLKEGVLWQLLKE